MEEQYVKLASKMGRLALIDGRSMSPSRLAFELGISPKDLRSWLRRTYPRSSGEWNTRWELSRELVEAAKCHFDGDDCADARKAPAATRPKSAKASRQNSDECYVLDLCDEILQEKSLRQHKFEWLVGDAGKTGRCVCLPVDGYYPNHALVIEYRERQHDEAVPFFDRRATVSGVGRGEQRRLYDGRREKEIPKRKLRLLIIRPSDLAHDSRLRLRRDRVKDATSLKTLLSRCIK